MTALVVSVIAYLIAPQIENTRQRRLLARQQKTTAVDTINTWVKDHLIAATLLYFSAFEREGDWRSAVLRYQESRASYAHSRALAVGLNNALILAKGLETLLRTSEAILKVAQDAFHLERDRNTPSPQMNPESIKKRLSELEKEFADLRTSIVEEAAQIYDLLNDDASQLLGFKKRFGIL
jgi:hypothetical protein